MHEEKEKRNYEETESYYIGVEQSMVSLKTRKKKKRMENGRARKVDRIIDTSNLNLNNPIDDDNFEFN